MADLLTTNDAARLLGLAPDTIRYLERIGRLAAQRTERGQRIFQRAAVEELRSERLRSERLRTRPDESGPSR
jgi:excisionase family DNA binding protein